MNRYHIEVERGGRVCAIVEAGNNRKKAESYARYINRRWPMINKVRVVLKSDPRSVWQIGANWPTAPIGAGKDVFRIERVYNMRGNRVVSRYWSGRIAE